MAHDRRFWAALGLAGLALGGGLLFRLAAQQPRPAAPAAQTARVDLSLGNLPEHPLKRAIELANASLIESQKLRDYTYVFAKREEVDGKLGDYDFVSMKLRREPYSVYAKTLGPVQPAGCEAIYVEGKNNGLVLAHGAGLQSLLGKWELDPHCEKMMEGNRYPITTAGFEKMLIKVINMYQQEIKHPESDVRIFSGAKVDGIDCTLVQVAHPVRRPEFPFYLTRIFYHEQTNLPVRWEALGWPEREGQEPPVVEDYTFRNVELSPGLTDADFDPKNEAYKY